jgi:hypothetical protein
MSTPQAVASLESHGVIVVCPHDCPDSCSMIVTVDKVKILKVRAA